MGMRDTFQLPATPKTSAAYAVVQALRKHSYGYENRGSRPDDPGWHACRCREWEGYWCSFYDEHLAPAILQALKEVSP